MPVVTTVLGVCLVNSKSDRGSVSAGALNDKHEGIEAPVGHPTRRRGNTHRRRDATRLNVSVGSLLKLIKDPIFTRRVGQERAVLARERSSQKWSPGVSVNATTFAARPDPNWATRA
jgi:hypothetical protein